MYPHERKLAIVVGVAAILLTISYMFFPAPGPTKEQLELEQQQLAHLYCEYKHGKKIPMTYATQEDAVKDTLWRYKLSLSYENPYDVPAPNCEVILNQPPPDEEIP